MWNDGRDPFPPIPNGAFPPETLKCGKFRCGRDQLNFKALLNRPGKLFTRDTALVKMLFTADGILVNAPLTADNMPLPLNAPLNPFTAFLAAVFKSDGRFLTPFIMPVTMFLPSENQLNAVNTLTIAVIIFGKLAINNGIARTKPIAKFVMIVTPVARIFGALSLIMPAKFVMIVGTYAISTGIELISPYAMFWISARPAFINFPALLLNDSVNCVSIGNACPKKVGMP